MREFWLWVTETPLSVVKVTFDSHQFHRSIGVITEGVTEWPHTLPGFSNSHHESPS